MWWSWPAPSAGSNHPSPHSPTLPHTFSQRIQLSVERMQRVVELARTIRERRNKPLKFPLKGLVVVHDDAAFLDDIQGEGEDGVGGVGGAWGGEMLKPS